MFNRQSEFSVQRERIEDRITLASGETKEARLKSWLAEKIREPRLCSRHPRTRLILSRRDTRISQGWKPRLPPDWGYEPDTEPGAFLFEAVLHCPACLTAHAFCPPEFHETCFKTFDTSTEERAHALARCREFAAQVNQSGCGFALLVGGPGTGKTRLACNIVRKLNDEDALYVRQGELTCALRATYGRKDVFVHRGTPHRRPESDFDDEAGDDEPPTPLEVVQKVRCLALDEIGCNPLANDERLLLDEMLKHRYDFRKPTILISNLPLTGTPERPGLKEFLGDALIDRIRQATGNGKFISQFSGESYRRAAGGNYLASLP